MVRFLDTFRRNLEMGKETLAARRRTHILLTPLDVLLMFAYWKTMFWVSRLKHEGLR